MSTILNIDTSMETAGVSIAKNGVIQSFLINTIQKEHASFLHNAVKKLLIESSTDIKQIDAIAVTNGPGSYTGLRVGLASAKGLCYALNKPLITIGTLNALATAAIDSSKEIAARSALYCPMIDARRLEVYTAVFDNNMTEILQASAMILHERSFEQILENNQVLFFGSGSKKWNGMVKSGNAIFLNELDITTAVCQLSFNKLVNNDFTDLTYSGPLYIKEFFSP